MADLSWHKIEIEIPAEDFIKLVVVRGKKLCLIRYAGELFLIQHSCPHAAGSLSRGWCEKGRIICPVHRYAYQLNSGRGDPGQGDYIECYPLRQEADGLYAGFKRRFWEWLFQ